MSDSIDDLSGSAYGGGMDPLDWATHLVASLLSARSTCQQRELNGLPPLAAWPDVSDQAVARKVLGHLLDAGWTPPTDAAVREAAARSVAARARFDAWWSTVPAADRDRAVEHYSRTGEWPCDVQPPTASAAAP